jgi:hypothetical protein
MGNDGVSPRVLNCGTIPKSVVSFMFLPLHLRSFPSTPPSCYLKWACPGKMSAPAGTWGRIPGRLPREFINIQTELSQIPGSFSLLLLCPLKFVWIGSGYATEYGGRMGSTLDCILEVPGSNVIPETSKLDSRFSYFSIFEPGKFWDYSLGLDGDRFLKHFLPFEKHFHHTARSFQILLPLFTPHT